MATIKRHCIGDHNGDTLLKNNRQLAKMRLTYLQKRLEKDRPLKAKYIEAVNRYLSEGHARLVSDKDTKAVWFYLTIP